MTLLTDSCLDRNSQVLGLDEFIADVLQRTSNEEDVEALKEMVDNQSAIIGKLINLLVDNNVVSFEAIKDIVPYGVYLTKVK